MKSRAYVSLVFLQENTGIFAEGSETLKQFLFICVVSNLGIAAYHPEIKITIKLEIIFKKKRK